MAGVGLDAIERAPVLDAMLCAHYEFGCLGEFGVIFFFSADIQSAAVNGAPARTSQL